MSEAPVSVTQESAQVKTLLVPDIDWVPVAAGKFIYGEDKAQTTLYLESFEIARYPVTNRQYQCFVDDGGYEDERWWQGLEKPAIEESSWPQGNRPRTNVDWNEVTAFACWLSVRLDDSSIRLPFEHEWEKAARGEQGLIYPWGNDYLAGFANVDESSGESGSSLQQTTAVGLFPQDESPCTARDMAGNVLEWCNEYQPDPQQTTEDDRPSPVLRGGSWLGGPLDARAALRSWLNPGSRDGGGGFRLLRSPPS